MTNDKAMVRDIGERQHPAVRATEPAGKQNKMKERNRVMFGG